MKKRVFLIVLDSFGIGEEPDAALFGAAIRLQQLPKAKSLPCP